MDEIYLLIADTITAVKNEIETPSIDDLVGALAEAFKEHDPAFDKVQFLNDSELAEAEL